MQLGKEDHLKLQSLGVVDGHNPKQVVLFRKHRCLSLILLLFFHLFYIADKME